MTTLTNTQLADRRSRSLRSRRWPRTPGIWESTTSSWASRCSFWRATCPTACTCARPATGISIPQDEDTIEAFLRTQELTPADVEPLSRDLLPRLRALVSGAQADRSAGRSLVERLDAIDDGAMDAFAQRWPMVERSSPATCSSRWGSRRSSTFPTILRACCLPVACSIRATWSISRHSRPALSDRRRPAERLRMGGADVRGWRGVDPRRPTAMIRRCLPHPTGRG